MTTPPTSLKTFALYALGYALTIASLILEVRHGGAIFAFIGFTGSLALTGHCVYRTARAMAFSPTADRMRAVPVRAAAGEPLVAA
ncbi:hypothetical protein NR798_02275 [Archangium gephyra]|uniref:hypothetical protein n=1 Tax=Archangium gephyra TaxID=48 RepID=UPI0035D52A73